MEPPYIGGYEVNDGDTIYHKVPQYDFETVSGEAPDLNGKIVILFSVQNTCYEPDDIYNCGYYPFHVEEILYDDLLKNKKKYKDVVLVSIVTDENGNSVEPNEKLIEKFEQYDSDLWILAKGNISKYYDFEVEDGTYSDQTNSSAYNEMAYLSTLLLIDKKRHIRGYFGGRLNAEIREFKDRLSVLKKSYQLKNE